jgi:hypothetical protein
MSNRFAVRGCGRSVGEARSTYVQRECFPWSAVLRAARSAVPCKSVAKATQVRILDPPHGAETAPDLRKPGQGPFSLSPAVSGPQRPETTASGHIVGRSILFRPGLRAGEA